MTISIQAGKTQCCKKFAASEMQLRLLYSAVAPGQQNTTHCQIQNCVAAWLGMHQVLSLVQWAEPCWRALGWQLYLLPSVPSAL